MRRWYGLAARLVVAELHGDQESVSTLMSELVDVAAGNTNVLREVLLMWCDMAAQASTTVTGDDGPVRFEPWGVSGQDTPPEWQWAAELLTARACGDEAAVRALWLCVPELAGMLPRMAAVLDLAGTLLCQGLCPQV